MTSPESAALASVLDEVDPRSPTACAGWTAHDLVAHLAAGAKETADLIDQRLAGVPVRATRSFEEREPPFRALPHDELRTALADQSRRKVAAIEALADREEEASVPFTGTTMTAPRFSTHARSEAALHRWDLVGDDDISDRLLAQTELTRHAVSLLNAIPILHESSRIREGESPSRIVLRSPGQPDVVLAVGEQVPFEVVDNGPADGDVIVTTDAANRLLVIWGRRSAARHLTIEAAPARSDEVASILWPSAVSWPRA